MTPSEADDARLDEIERIHAGHKINNLEEWMDDTIAIARRMQERARVAERWYEAVINAAVVDWTYTKEDEDNPHLCINKLLVHAGNIALDPRVSKEAAELHERLRTAEARIAELERECERLRALKIAESRRADLAEESIARKEKP